MEGGGVFVYTYGSGAPATAGPEAPVIIGVPKHNRLLGLCLAELSVAEDSSLNRRFWEESSRASPGSGGSCMGGRTEILLSVLGGGAGLLVIRD